MLRIALNFKFIYFTDPDEYNDIIQKSYLAAVRADGGMYSHPLMLVNLLCEWRSLDQGSHHLNQWLRRNNVVKSRMQQFDGVAKNIARTVAAVLTRIENRLDARRIPRYDLSGWLAMQDDIVSDDDSNLSDLSGLPFIDDTADEDIALDIEFLRDEINEINFAAVAALSDIKSLKVSTIQNDALNNSCRINLCRLALAWASDGFLLCQTPKKKIPVDYYSTVRLGNSSLSKDQFASLFPADVPVKMSCSGSLIYDGKVKGSDLLDVLKRVCNIGLFMADSRYNSAAINMEPWRQNPVLDDAPPVVWISIQLKKATTAVFLALPDTESENLFASIFTSGFLQNTGEMCGIYRIFGVEAVSKTEMKNLKLSRNVLKRSLTMTIPSGGNAKLTAVGCEPCCEDLRHIFDINESFTADHLSLNQKSNLPTGVTVQVVDREYNLFFEREKFFPGSKYYFPDSLIEDIPIGMRLLNAYKGARFKDK